MEDKGENKVKWKPEGSHFKGTKALYDLTYIYVDHSCQGRVYPVEGKH